jgi:hypothetical protein
LRSRGAAVVDGIGKIRPSGRVRNAQGHQPRICVGPGRRTGIHAGIGEFVINAADLDDVVVGGRTSNCASSVAVVHVEHERPAARDEQICRRCADVAGRRHDDGVIVARSADGADGRGRAVGIDAPQVVTARDEYRVIEAPRLAVEAPDAVLADIFVPVHAHACEHGRILAGQDRILLEIAVARPDARFLRYSPKIITSRERNIHHV